MPPKIQSVVFKRKLITEKDAEKWLKKFGYKKTFNGKKVHKTKDYLRYTQQDPKKFKRLEKKMIFYSNSDNAGKKIYDYMEDVPYNHSKIDDRVKFVIGFN